MKKFFYSFPVICFFLLTSFTNFEKSKLLSPAKKTCTVVIDFKNAGSATIRSTIFHDDDETYSGSNIPGTGWFGCTFDATANIFFSVKINSPHSSGRITISNSTSGFYYCISVSSINEFYSYTLPLPPCNSTYNIQYDDNPC